jgi:hypothetical protein
MDNILKLRSSDELFFNVEKIRTIVDDNGFAILRGIIDNSMLNFIRSEILKDFDSRCDTRVSGKYLRKAKNFQRLDIGEYASSSRCARYFFFFPWNNNDPFKSINELQMKLFNLLAKKPSSFGFDQDSNSNRFRASFVLQYPTGAGFMSRHCEKSGEEEGDKAYVIYLALTTRGVDFKSGGAYIERNGEMFDIDAHVMAGDLVIYRGDYYHGVSNIDSSEFPVFEKVCGRMILTTVVKYF